MLRPDVGLGSHVQTSTGQIDRVGVRWLGRPAAEMPHVVDAAVRSYVDLHLLTGHIAIWMLSLCP